MNAPAALCSFRLGPYTVLRYHDADLYRIFLGTILIGKCYSMPSQSDCEWLERQQRAQTMYAYSTAPLPDVSGIRRSFGRRDRGKRNRASKA